MIFHANKILTVILLLERIAGVSCNSKLWYNWFEDNSINGTRRTIVDGTLPTLSCPYGTYRQFKDEEASYKPGGVNLDGCLKCPKGVYGNATDLKSSECTAPCPVGTYSDREGATSVEDCKLCPMGTFGEKAGLVNDSCSGSCNNMNKGELQYFSDRLGLISREECTLCPPYYESKTCRMNATMPENFTWYYFNESDYFEDWQYVEEIDNVRTTKAFMEEWQGWEEAQCEFCEGIVGSFD